MKFDTEVWFDGQTEVSFIPAERDTEELPVTAVKIFDIANGEVLLVEVSEKGGWDIPGGHVEGSETPLEAAEREVKEETNGKVSDLSLFGYLDMKKVIETPQNKDYPDRSLIAMFTGKVSDVATNNNSLTFEATRLGYYKLEEVSMHSPFWTKLSQQVLDYAASR